MKPIIYVFILVFFLGCATHKEINSDISNFQLRKIEVNDIEKIENRNYGIQELSNVPTSQGYFPELNILKFSQPKFYNRKKGSLLTEVSYYYTEEDSVVRVISYAWDELRDSDSIHKIYNQNQKLFNQYFQKKGVEKNVHEATYWEDEIVWEDNHIFVFQFILGNKKGAYRTRTIIRWK